MSNKRSEELIEASIKARETILPWNRDNIFVLFWGYGSASIKCVWSEYKVTFSSTEKTQLEEIGKIIKATNLITEYVPMDVNQRPVFSITLFDESLCSYLCSLGFEGKDKSPGLEFPDNIPIELMGRAMHAYWLSSGGTETHEKGRGSVFFYGYGKRFLEGFKEKIECYLDLPKNYFGELIVDLITPGNMADIWKLQYDGIAFTRIMSKMLNWTAQKRYSTKEQKALLLFMDYASRVIDIHEEEKGGIDPYKDKNIVALQDGAYLMGSDIERRYRDYCKPNMESIKKRAEEHYHLEADDSADL
jgi:hypothetical protein